MSHHRQSGYSPKIYADDRWLRWDSKKWPLERERRAHQPQPLKLPQRPLNPVLYLGHHQETCARGITSSALLAELLQAAAALPRENPKALAALATLLQTARTSAPESLRHLASRATANKEQATVQASRWLASSLGTTNLRLWISTSLGSSGILFERPHHTRRAHRRRWSGHMCSMWQKASPRGKVGTPCPPP